MITSERVMAVICRPVSGKELVLTEKDNNVIIHRRMEYDSKSGIQTLEVLFGNLRNLPIKLMFIFGLGDTIIINGPNDVLEVNRRLLAL
jgi:hypothetical protein